MFFYAAQNFVKVFNEKINLLDGVLFGSICLFGVFFWIDMFVGTES